MKHLKLALFTAGVGVLFGGVCIVGVWYCLTPEDYSSPIVSSDADAVALARRFVVKAQIATGQYQMSAPPRVHRGLHKGALEWGLAWPPRAVTNGIRDLVVFVDSDGYARYMNRTSPTGSVFVQGTLNHLETGWFPHSVAPNETRRTAVTAPASPSTNMPLSPAKLVNVGRSDDGKWYVTVSVTNPLSVAVDCSLYVAADRSTRSELSTGPAVVEWSRLPPDQTGSAPFSTYPPMMGYRYGLSGPVVRIDPTESAELRALTGWVSATNENLLVILYRPRVSPEPKGTDLPVLAARLPRPSSAEHGASTGDGPVPPSLDMRPPE
jgi:hypothetical protein